MSSHDLLHMTQEFKFVKKYIPECYRIFLETCPRSFICESVFIPHAVIDFHKERAVDSGLLVREEMQGEVNCVLNCQSNYQLCETNTVHLWIQYHANQLEGLSLVFDPLQEAGLESKLDPKREEWRILDQD